MARPREHDEQAARAGAIQAFLRSGYAATSLTELEEATGLDRRQLYNQYGDKRGVFLQALDDFQEQAAERFLSLMETSNAAVSSIAVTLHGMVDLADSGHGRLGCLVCNTSREPIAATDAEVQERVQRYFARIEAAYANALKGSSLPARARRQEARHLLATHVALCVMCRAGSPVETLRDAVEAAVRHLG